MNAPRRIYGAIVGSILTAVPHIMAADAVSATAWQRFRVRSVETLNALARLENDSAGRDADATVLSFQEFFEPVGDGGLEYTARLRSLAGKRVRLTGYMVREERRYRGLYLLAPHASTAQLAGACVAPDVPPNVVHVHLSADAASSLVPYQPGRMSVVGILEIGPKREADGRNSAVRLRLELPRADGNLVSVPATAAHP
jgi:hypothetical protein